MLLTSVWTLTALLPARPTLRAQCAHRSKAAFMSSTEGMACGGGHVVMDYEDFFVDAAPAGETKPAEGSAPAGDAPADGAAPTEETKPAEGE